MADIIIVCCFAILKSLKIQRAEMFLKLFLLSNLISLNLSLFAQINEDVGMRVRLEDYPFVLGLQHIDGTLVCAAVLISGKYSMTAGKCLTKPGDSFLPAPRKFRVIGGISQTDRHGVSESFEVRVPDMFYVHPNFSQGLFTHGIYHNDVIVIEVKKPFQTSFMKPVSRYLLRGNPNNIMFAVEIQKAMRYLCMVVGWQKDSVFSRYESMKLVGHVVTLIKNTDCLESFCKSESEMCNENLKTEESLICGMAGSKTASCKIDSAGVLMCEGSFTGFLSWKPKCGFSRTKVPNIFNAFWPSVDFFKNFTTDAATVPAQSSLLVTAVTLFTLRSSFSTLKTLLKHF